MEAEYDTSDIDTDGRKRIRDQYSRKMIAVIDKRYNDFLDDLVMQRKGFDASTDIIAISLDTASVLFTPTTTKSILAGLSGLTTASKTAINKVYFYEQTLPVMITQMNSGRQSVLADIMEGLSSDDKTYPLHHAQRDLARYFTAGTIDGALAEIQKQAAKKADDAQTRIRLEVDDALKAAGERRRQALEMIIDENSFKNMRTKISNWWSKLDEEKRNEQASVITAWADKHGVSLNDDWLIEKAKEKVLDPNHMGSMLDGLKYNEKNKQFLADIVRNAVDIKVTQ